MNRIRAGLTILMLVLSANSLADVYRYQGPLYQPGDIDHGAYTTAMRVSGYIRTSSPIPPNQTDFDLASILTGFSFSDGLQTIDDSVAYNVLIQSGVSTDANGNLTYLNMSVANVSNPAIQLDDVTGSIQAGSDVFEAARFKCTAYSTQCDTNDLTDYAASQEQFYVPWTHEFESSSIPTLSHWAMLALALSLLLLARRRFSV